MVSKCDLASCAISQRTGRYGRRLLSMYRSCAGISHVGYSAALPGASNTALPITTSCSFNRSLWKSTGNQIAREARAFMNAGLADSTYWAPGEAALCLRAGQSRCLVIFIAQRLLCASTARYGDIFPSVHFFSPFLPSLAQ